MAALVLGMAWSRLVSIQMDRYALLFVPALCAAYFSWLLYGPEIVRDKIAIAFAVAGLLAFPFNLEKGVAWRNDYIAQMVAFEGDLSAGLSWQELVDKDLEGFARWYQHPDVLAENMRILNQAKIGPIGRAVPR